MEQFSVSVSVSVSQFLYLKALKAIEKIVVVCLLNMECIRKFRFLITLFRGHLTSDKGMIKKNREKVTFFFAKNRFLFLLFLCYI